MPEFSEINCNFFGFEDSMLDELRSSGYKMPFIPIILVSASFICIQGFITYIGEKTLRKESVIDRVRYNE
ncbi:hypothetical protein [Clostridium thailandense]|uniref:hypothetical protein n=1 Tax=Clostridium thailandense TaxID=2794346 RepID=UPI0039893120